MLSDFLGHIRSRFNQHHVSIPQKISDSITSSYRESHYKQETRLTGRVAIDIPVRWNLCSDGPFWYGGKISDLSYSGCRLELNRLISAATCLNLTVTLPDQKRTLRLKGRVQWITPTLENTGHFECGIAFEEMNQNRHRDQLASFIVNRACDATPKPKSAFTVRLASNVEEVKKYFSLTPYTHHHLLPMSRFILLEKNNDIFGGIDLIPDSACGIPMDNLFPRDIIQLRSQDKNIAEHSLPALSNSSSHNGLGEMTHAEKHRYFFFLVKFLIEASRSMGVSDLLTHVAIEDETLYTFLGYERIGKTRFVGGIERVPMRLWVVNPLKNIQTSSGLYRLYLKDQFPQEAFVSNFYWNVADIRELILSREGFWDKIPSLDQQFIEICYPGINMGDSYQFSAA